MVTLGVGADMYKVKRSDGPAVKKISSQLEIEKNNTKKKILDQFH